MSITQIESYKGETCIVTTPYTSSDIQAFIDRYEVFYLNKVLGKPLTTAFLANIGDPRFVDLLAEGVEEMLRFLIYYKYTLYLPSQSTTQGKKTTKNVHSISSTGDSNIYDMQRQGTCIAEALRIFITDNIDTYPEFNKGTKEKLNLTWKHFTL